MRPCTSAYFPIDEADERSRARLRRAPHRRSDRRHRGIPESRKRADTASASRGRSASSCIRRWRNGRPNAPPTPARPAEHVVEPEDAHVCAARGARRPASRRRRSASSCFITIPSFTATVPHSVGMQKGLVGVVHAFADREHDAHQQRGDRARDPAYARRLGQIRSGYAGAAVSHRLRGTRARAAFIRRQFTEIMAGRYAVDSSTFEMPESLDEVVVGAGHRARDPLGAAMSATLLETAQLRVAVPGRVLIDSIRLRHPRRRVHRAAGRQWHRQITAVAHARGTARACRRLRCQLDGRDIAVDGRVATSPRQLGFLPQDPEAAPQGSLQETVLLGRFAHLGFWEDAAHADSQRVDAGARRRRPRGASRARAGHSVGRRAAPRCHRAAAGAGAFYLPARRAHQSPRPSAAARHPRAFARAHARRRGGHREPARARISRCASRIAPACCRATVRCELWSTARRSIPVISAAFTASSMSKRAWARSASWRRTEVSDAVADDCQAQSPPGSALATFVLNQKRRDLFERCRARRLLERDLLDPQQPIERLPLGRAPPVRAAPPRSSASQ